MPRNMLLSRAIISGIAAGGFRVDSPVRKPVASEMARSSPPYTDRAREEPWEGVSDAFEPLLTVGQSCSILRSGR